MITGADILTALYLICVIEGLLYGFFPAKMKEIMAQVLNMPDHYLKNFGLGIAAFGILMIWIRQMTAA
jgi:uncharacterized protein YjeT (DUF2065 family)